jgi:hypothetical protein
MVGELKRAARLALRAWALLLVVGAEPAMSAAPAALRVSYPSPTATQLPLWAAKEKKL